MKYIWWLVIFLLVASILANDGSQVGSYVTYEMRVTSYVIFVPILSYLSYKNYKTIKDVIPETKGRNKYFELEDDKVFSLVKELFIIFFVPYLLVLLFTIPFIKLYNNYYGYDVIYYTVVDKLEYVHKSKRGDYYYIFIHSPEYGNEILDSKDIYHRVKINTKLKVKKRDSNFGYVIKDKDVSLHYSFDWEK